MARSFREPPAVVKIGPATHASLIEISREENRSMGEIIGHLVERYERERFWKAAEQGLLRMTKEDASTYRADVEKLELLANDGLEEEPRFFTDEEEAEIRAEIIDES